MLLTVGMVGMWLSTSAGAWLLLDVEPWIALLIGAILTPTDPVVASSLVTGRLAEANRERDAGNAPTRTPRRGVAFLSWYGPLGVAAIYYALFVERYRLEEFDRVFAACTLAIAVSVVAFSVTATPGVRRYAGRKAITTLRHPVTKDIDGAP